MWRWLIWSLLVLAWTAVLEAPFSEPEDVPGADVVITYKRIIGKTAHVVGYAVLAILSAWLPVRAQYRWTLMLFLMGHAWGTEMLQAALSSTYGRGGDLTDVGLDMLGIGVGAAVAWKWWTRD